MYKVWLILPIQSMPYTYLQAFQRQTQGYIMFCGAALAAGVGEGGRGRGGHGSEGNVREPPDEPNEFRNSSICPAT